MTIVTASTFTTLWVRYFGPFDSPGSPLKQLLARVRVEYAEQLRLWDVRDLPGRRCCSTNGSVQEQGWIREHLAPGRQSDPSCPAHPEELELLAVGACWGTSLRAGGSGAHSLVDFRA